MTLDFLKNKCGVYGIQVGDWIYVGSSCNMYNRVKSHLRLLQTGKHYNKKFQSIWNGVYRVILLEECPEDKLLELEHKHTLKCKNVINTINYFDHSKTFTQGLRRKILSKINKVESGCWEFTGSIKDGYGRIRVDGKTVLVHRIMYYFYNNEYPYLVRHLCHNRKCCNPAHLVKGSSRENSLDNHRELREKFVISYSEHSGNLDVVCQELKITKPCAYSYRKEFFPEDVRKDEYLTIFGERKLTKDWIKDSRAANITRNVLRGRIKSGWTPEKALITPVIKTNKSKPKTYSMLELRGLFLYGNPISGFPKDLKDKVESYNGEYIIPEDTSYTYWISEDKSLNIHFRKQKFYYVINGVLYGPCLNYLKALEELAETSGNVEVIKELEDLRSKIFHRN